MSDTVGTCKVCGATVHWKYRRTADGKNYFTGVCPNGHKNKKAEPIKK